jgi:hypothetical protein
MLCDLPAERLPAESPLGRRLESWPGDVFADVVTLHRRLRPRGEERLLATAQPEGHGVQWQLRD